MNPNKACNNNPAPALRIFKAVSAITIAAAFIIGIIAFTISFSDSGRYFVPSAIVTALYLVLATAVVFAIAAMFIFKGNSISAHTSKLCKALSILTASACAIPFIYYIYSDLSAKAASLTAAAGSSAALYQGLDAISIAIILTSLLAAVYSLSASFGNNKALTLITGYTRVLFFALIITKLYLDFSVELNSPVKLLVQFAATAAMFETIAELKILTEKVSAPAFLSSKFIFSLLCLLNLAAFTFEIIPNQDKYGADLATFSFMFILLSVESLVKLFTCRISVKAECDSADVGDQVREINTIKLDLDQDLSTSEQDDSQIETNE